MESQSDQDGYWPIKKLAISVLNQETSYRLSANWILALCTSWRRQNIYREGAPYYLKNPSLRNEIRWYGRIFYKHKSRKADFSYSFRPEYRLFYTPDWKNWETPRQWRLRLKAQVALHVFRDKHLEVILANEFLMVSDKLHSANGESQWPFQFSEDRMTMFLRKHLFENHITCDLGLMHQFLKEGSQWKYALYLSGDLIINDPFGLLKRSSTDDSSVGF